MPDAEIPAKEAARPVSAEALKLLKTAPAQINIMAKSVTTHIAEAVEAGKKRDYKTAIRILENLAAQGFAEDSSPFSGSGKGGNPEIYLYLSRAWTAEKNYGRAAAYGKAYTKRRPEDPAGFFFLGRAYAAAGFFDAAARCFEKSVKLNPRSLEARAMLGFVYLKGKKARLARRVFEEALKYAPSDRRLNNGYLNALFVEAVYELKNGSPDMARQMFTFVIKNNIDGVVPRLYLAHALKMQGYLKEAYSQYEAASEFAPQDKTLKLYPAMIKLEMGDAAGAAEDLAELGIQTPEDQISGQFIAMGAVKKHLEKSEFSKASYAAKVYIRSFGSSAEIRLLAAEASRASGNIKTALNHYKCAIKDDPKSPYPHYGILLTLQESYQWKELPAALRRAEASGACAPDDIYYYKTITEAHIGNRPEKPLSCLQALIKNRTPDSALFNALGCTYVKLDMADIALNWYEKALQVSPKNEEALVGKIACYETLALNDKAYAAYTAYLCKWDKNIYVRKDFVLFLEKLNMWEEAADQLEILMGQYPQAQFTPDLALFRRKAGQYQKAAILYRKMLKAKPEERGLLHNLVFCLDKMAKTKIALSLLQAARNLFGIQPETFLIEGILLLRLKRKEEAVRAFQYIVEKYPKNTQAAELLKRALGEQS